MTLRCRTTYRIANMEQTEASEVIAKYAATPKAELERTVPLDSDEVVIVAVRAATRYSGDSLLGRLNTSTGGRRSFIRLTTRRLCIIRRYGFIRDRILVIPPAAITELKEQGPTEAVRISFRAGLSGQTLTIATWSQSRVPVDAQALQSDDLNTSFRKLALALGATETG